MKLAPSPGRSWWEDEVQALLARAPSLPAPARAAVAAVLSSLATDHSTDAPTRRDLRRLRRALAAQTHTSEAAKAA